MVGIAVSSVIRDTNTVFTQVLGSRVRARAFPVFSSTPTGHCARSPSGPSYPVTIDWNGEKMKGKVFYSMEHYTIYDIDDINV